MKSKIAVILLLIIFTTLLSAQTKVYLFETFQDGKAVYKEGRVSRQKFNYDLLTKKILFKSDDTVLELANPAQFSYVQIGSSIFECAGGERFYEKMTLPNDMQLYIYRAATLIPKGKDGGYGSTDQTSSVTKLSHYDQMGDSKTHELEVQDKFTVVYSNTCYLKINGKFKKISSAQNLSKLYKGHESEIMQYIKENNLGNFRKLENIKKAVSFCSKYS